MSLYGAIAKKNQFSPGGSRIVAGFDRVARLFDASTMESIGEPLEHFNEETAPLSKTSVFRVAFSPDGSVILTGGWDGTCRLWDAATLEPIGDPLIHPSEVKSLVCSPDGTRILAGFADGTVRLWDLLTREPVGVPLHHREVVSGVAFSPDGSRFITSSLDGTAQLWDTPTQTRLRYPADQRGSSAFSSSGRRSEWAVAGNNPAEPGCHRARIIASNNSVQRTESVIRDQFDGDPAF